MNNHFSLRAAFGRLARDLPFALGRGVLAIWNDVMAPQLKLVIALGAAVWLILLTIDAIGVAQLPPARWPTWRL